MRGKSLLRYGIYPERGSENFDTCQKLDWSDLNCKNGKMALNEMDKEPIYSNHVLWKIGCLYDNYRPHDKQSELLEE